MYIYILQMKKSVTIIVSIGKDGEETRTPLLVLEGMVRKTRNNQAISILKERLRKPMHEVPYTS